MGELTDKIKGNVNEAIGKGKQAVADSNNDASLAAEGKKLELLGDDDETANRAYTKQFALDHDRVRGQQYGLEYAELFHYIPADESAVEGFVREHAVPL